MSSEQLEKNLEDDQESGETGDFTQEEYDYMFNNPLNRVGRGTSHEALNRIVDKGAVRALVEKYKEDKKKGDFSGMDEAAQAISDIIEAM